MKKLILTANVLLLVIAAWYMISHTEMTDRMFPRSSNKAISKIKKNLKLTDEDILESLCYEGEHLPKDTAQGVFYLPLSMDDEAWENGRITTDCDGVNIVFLKGADNLVKSECISQGTKIPFYAYNKTEYREYYLVLTGLPVIEISSSEGTGLADAQAAASEEEYEQLIASDLYHMRVLSADTKFGAWVTESDMQMHVRGNTSRTYPKKGFKVKLLKQNSNGKYVANKVSLLDMRKDNDWILYAMYNEGTKIRDALSIDVWNAYGASNNDFKGTLSPKMTYVEVIWDGQYYGMYGLMEPVDEKQVNLTGDDGVHKPEYLYKKKKPSTLDVDAIRSDNGELLREGFELKSEQSSDSDAWNTLADLIDWQQNASDEDFIARAEQMVDLDNTIDMWIFTNLITGYDQLGKNVYYIAKAENGSYRFYFAPWDMDLTWGYTSDAEKPLGCKFEDYIYDAYVWWEPGNRMIELNAAGAADMAEKRYRELRSTVLTDDWLGREVDKLEHLVQDSGAFARDAERWPEGNHDGDYEGLRTYMTKHMEWLDTFMNDIEEGMESIGR